MEIPQARADILTASLRANPILYADSQLIPYGSFSDRRPGGPTQYDLNISHPLDYSHKRRARIDYASRALKVTEAQYQDAVRIEINNLYTAFLDVLAARQTVRYTRASVAGLERLLRATRLLYEKDIGSRADVNQVKAQMQIAEVGVLDAEENLRRAKRTLGMMLGLPPDQAEALEVRGTIEDRGPPPPPLDEMVRLALSCRPDVVAYRLGVQVARVRAGPADGQSLPGRLPAVSALHVPEQRPVPERKRDLLGAGRHGPLAGLQPQPGEHRAGQAQRRPVPDRAGGDRASRGDRGQSGRAGVRGHGPDRRADPGPDHSRVARSSATTASSSSREGKPTWSPISRPSGSTTTTSRPTTTRRSGIGAACSALNTALGQRVLP